VIADYAKIDSHVHVGHNVRVGRNASVTCGVVLCGHSVVGEDAWIGVNSSIRDGSRVGRHALVGMDVSLQGNLEDRSVARAPRPRVTTRADHDDSTIGFNKR
jgi:UDP-3-O-[3-hydroxymyristoyl] glucosamine N-acyltransferase